MAILKIARMGHPVLSAPAAAVEDPRDPEIRRLAEDMIETMVDAPGTGLAAPQVHVAKRVVVYFVTAERARRAGDEAGEDVPLSVLINPRLDPLGEATDEDWEACLSVPGLAGQVRRHLAVRCRALTLDGEALDFEAQGFHARVLQHECDHLDGILYPQRMTDLSRLVFASELAHWSVPEPIEE